MNLRYISLVLEEFVNSEKQWISAVEAIEKDEKYKVKLTPTAGLVPCSSTMAWDTPCAVGDRQILPMQTNSTFIIGINLVKY